MDIICGSIVILASLGLLFGIILAVASKFFHVEIDERIEKVNEALPGANCGGCGFPGCIGYAEAVVNGEADATMCAPGGSETAEKIAEVLGVTVEAGAKKYPTVKCQGREAKASFEYDGPQNCVSANMLQGGFKQCTAGCLGLADCKNVCPVDAITMTDGLPVIDEEICISCGKCATACPRNVIEMRPENYFVHVLCENHDKGGAAKRACPNACIGCKKCEKECPFDAIHIENFLAVIDYEKCKNCGKCVKVCPTDVIVNVRKERKARQKKQQEQQEAPTSEA